jgi:micrococcal nuclease
MELKKLNIILIFILFLSIMSIAGCISQNNTSYDYNQSYNQSSTSKTANNTTEAPSQSSTSQATNTTKALKTNYEASGYCSYVVDGDTIDVDGVGRIRFVGVNTPERGQAGYQEAKDFVKGLCLGKTVGLDIDNAKHYDKYGRVLSVVYAGDTNVNAELLKKGYAEVMYIPPSEFNPYSWAGTTNYRTVSKSTSSNNADYYMGNRNSKKFHEPSCSSVSKMSEKNKVRLTSRQEAINGGYNPCGICNP